MLHRYDWSESSLILELFTRAHGRVAVVAKGAKRPYSQLRAVLLPFQRLQVSWGQRKGETAEIQTLRSAEWQGGGLMLGGGAMLSGFYLNELLIKLLVRQDPHPALFEAYAYTLPLLAAEDPGVVQAALRGFELVLLRELGVLPALDRVTLTQQPLAAGRRYELAPEAGLQASEDGLPPAAWQDLEQALGLGEMAPLHRACAAALSGLKGQLRGLLHYHLGHQRLRTRQLLMELPRA